MTPPVSLVRSVTISVNVSLDALMQPQSIIRLNCTTPFAVLHCRRKKSPVPARYMRTLIEAISLFASEVFLEADFFFGATLFFDVTLFLGDDLFFGATLFLGG